MATGVSGLNSTASSNAAAVAALTNTATASGVRQDLSYDATHFIVCYSPTMITTSGLWEGDNPFDYSLPLFILQAIMVIVITRGLYIFVFRNLRQPRFIAEIIGGILLGPVVLGRIPNYMDLLFPTRSLAVLETMASLGLVYFIFLVGLQVDLSTVRRAGKRAWAITSAGVVLPIMIELIAFAIFGEEIRRRNYTDSFLIFVGVSLSITAYPVLARILAELKLLNTDTGKLAMCTAILNDGIAWILLAIALALTGQHRSYVAPVGIIFSGMMFVIILYYTVRPVANWIMSKTKEGEAVGEVYVVAMLVTVLVCGVTADAVGIHAVFGAFALGVVIPNGSLGAVMIEKLEDFTSGFMMPLFFAVVGIKVDFSSIRDPGVYGFLIGVILCACLARVGIVLLVSMFYAMPTREGLSLGILMNTKGLMELIVLHIALDKKVLYPQSYSIMILMSAVMTALVTPLVMLVHGPSRHFVAYKRRTIEKGRPDSELRTVACIHTTRNVPSTISLLEISHPTKRSPIFVYTVHLVELTGRESAMLIVHESNQESRRRRPGVGGGQGNLNRVKTQSDQIIKAFESYEQHAGGVSVQPLTVVSAYSTMHEDVCNLAEDKHAALLILPFHKQHTVDGDMEILNPGIHTLNQNVLANAPCSVGILVDRGLGGTSRVVAGQHAAHHIAVIFVGGSDDREALAYASRMAEHPGTAITVLRFLDANQPQGARNPSSTTPSDARVVNVLSDRERERLLDDECVKEFRVKTMSHDMVVYMEKVVANGEETVTAIRSMESIYDLYIVGRGEGMDLPLTEGMTDWTESPELGAIGDLLASSDFLSTVSVLVIQQYKGAVPGLEAPGSPVSPLVSGNQIQQYLNKANTKFSSGWGP